MSKVFKNVLNKNKAADATTTLKEIMGLSKAIDKYGVPVNVYIDKISIQ